MTQNIRHNHVNINLQLVHEDNNTQIGGLEAIYKTINNKHYNTLVGGAYKFQFKDAEHNHIDKYFSNTHIVDNFFGVFKIHSKFTDEKINKDFLIILIPCTDDDLLHFIDKYYHDKQIIPNNIYNIDYYGIIKDENNENITVDNKVLFYVITPVYQTYLSNLSLRNKKIVLRKLIKLCSDLNKQQFFIFNLKYKILGCDDNFNPVILNYDNYTLVKYVPESYFNDGVFNPYYIIEKFKNKEVIKEELLTKIMTGAIADVIIGMFFNKSLNLNAPIPNHPFLLPYRGTGDSRLDGDQNLRSSAIMEKYVNSLVIPMLDDSSYKYYLLLKKILFTFDGKCIFKQKFDDVISYDEIYDKLVLFDEQIHPEITQLIGGNVDDNSDYWKNKYIKYKTKYLQLANKL